MVYLGPILESLKVKLEATSFKFALYFSKGGAKGRPNLRLMFLFFCGRAGALVWCAEMQEQIWR